MINVGYKTNFLLKSNWMTANSAIFERDSALKQIVPPDAFVITDNPSRCNWYVQLRYCCFAPWNEKTMKALLKKFPDAYVLLFDGMNRIGEGYQALLSNSTHVKKVINEVEVFFPSNSSIH